MTTNIKALAIAASVVTVVLVQKYTKEMEAINNKFEMRKDSANQLMARIMLLADSIKTTSNPQFVINESDEEVILNFTTKEAE